MANALTAIINHDVSFKQAVADRVRERADNDTLTLLVPDTAEAFREQLADADVLLTVSWNDDYLDDADGLQWVQSLSAGYDQYPLETLQERGIRLTTASGVHPEPIAEHVYGYLLGIERRLFQAQDAKRRKEWRKGEYSLAEIAGKTMCIIGMGAIGQEIARKADTFNMAVIGVDPELDHGLPSVDDWYTPEEQDTALEQADYVVLAAPLTPETRHMIGETALDTMRDDAILVNIGRGGLIDEPALIAALQDETIRFAALDVFEEEPLPVDSPLWELDNCVLTPHNSGSTPVYGERAADVFLDNLERFRTGTEMSTEVSF